MKRYNIYYDGKIKVEENVLGVEENSFGYWVKYEDVLAYTNYLLELKDAVRKIYDIASEVA